MGGALPGDEPEAAADGAADRPPGVEGLEDVAEEDAEQREAEPGGDEEEGDREVAIRRFGAVDAGVDRRPPSRKTPSAAADDLGGNAEQDP